MIQVQMQTLARAPQVDIRRITQLEQGLVHPAAQEGRTVRRGRFPAEQTTAATKLKIGAGQGTQVCRVTCRGVGSLRAWCILRRLGRLVLFVEGLIQRRRAKDLQDHLAQSRALTLGGELEHLPRLTTHVVV